VHDLKWTESEKRIARGAFEAALRAELAEALAEFKTRAAAAGAPHDMWLIAEDVQSKRHEIDQKYDYRYSQLVLVFGRLVREGRVQEAQLAGLTEEKLAEIRHIASL